MNPVNTGVDPLGWLDDWLPSVDGIRTKEKKKKLPAFIQDAIDKKKAKEAGGDEEDGEEEKSKEKKKKKGE